MRKGNGGILYRKKSCREEVLPPRQIDCLVLLVLVVAVGATLASVVYLGCGSLAGGCGGTDLDCGSAD